MAKKTGKIQIISIDPQYIKGITNASSEIFKAEEIEKSYFPMLIEYIFLREQARVDHPEDIISGRSFRIVEVHTHTAWIWNGAGVAAPYERKGN